MKKMLLSIFAYTAFAFFVCLAVSGFRGNVPTVLDGQRVPYLFFRALQYFLKLLPALFCSAYLVILSIYFGEHTGNAKERFSPAIFHHFKTVMITSLGMVFLLALSAEIFLPVIHARQHLAEEAPHLLNEYLISGRYCFVIKNYYLAHEYGRQALRLSPNNKEAQTLIDDSERALHSMRARVQTEEVQKNSDLEWRELQNETVTTLLEKAQKAYDAERWFDAHYYAELALTAGSDKDTNLQDAKRLSAQAWNNLNRSGSLTDFEAKSRFDKKKSAYADLMNGDNLKAYYEFMDLYNESGILVDPDVKNFFEIAKERLAREAFFIDETLHLQLFEAAQNVYFTVTHANGAKDVIFIKGITTVSNSGRMIQYLREFSLYAYSADGHFVRSITTPYAKLVAEPVSFFDEATALQNDLQDAFKNVPYVILKSVSRESNRMKNDPVYTYATDIPEEDRTYETALLLAMPFDDFNLAVDASVSPKDMHVLSLIKMIRKAHLFGHSSEVCNATVISRLTYPFLMLILFLFCASVSWNYRIKKNQVFKFTWAFALPITTVVLYVAVEILLYVSELLCYALVGFWGHVSIVSAVVIYTILLILVSVLFLARTSSQ